MWANLFSFLSIYPERLSGKSGRRTVTVFDVFDAGTLIGHLQTSWVDLYRGSGGFQRCFDTSEVRKPDYKVSPSGTRAFGRETSVAQSNKEDVHSIRYELYSDKQRVPGGSRVFIYPIPTSQLSEGFVSLGISTYTQSCGFSSGFLGDRILFTCEVFSWIGMSRLLGYISNQDHNISLPDSQPDMEHIMTSFHNMLFVCAHSYEPILSRRLFDTFQRYQRLKNEIKPKKAFQTHENSA